MKTLILLRIKGCVNKEVLMKKWHQWQYLKLCKMGGVRVYLYYQNSFYPLKRWQSAFMHAESSVSALKRVTNNAAIIDIIQTSEEMSYNLPSWEGTRTVLISYIVPYINSCHYHIICYLNRDIFYFSVASKTKIMSNQKTRLSMMFYYIVLNI